MPATTASILRLLIWLFMSSCWAALLVPNNASLVQFILSGDIKQNAKTTTTTTTQHLLNGLTNISSKATGRREVHNNNYSNSVFEHLNIDNINKKNVKQLVKTMDRHLCNIRSELCVTVIQEIFDSMQFSANKDSTSNNNNSEGARKKYARNKLLQDLQYFSERLQQKLRKASHVVMDLRDFFQYNITQVRQQRLAQKNIQNRNDKISGKDDGEENLSATSNMDSDYDTDDTDNMDEYAKIYLSTFIEAMAQPEDKADFGVNYKQHIQILNFLKTDQVNEELMNIFLSSNSELSLEMNAFIADKVDSIKQELLRTSEVYELHGNIKAQENIDEHNIKPLGSHLKHIFFLSPSDNLSDKTDSYFDEYRQLYVSAVQRKFVCLLIDVGSAMNPNLLDLTRAFVFNVLQLLSETDLVQIITVASTTDTMLLETSNSLDNTTGIYYATRGHKDDMLTYLANLNLSKNATNHTLGFQYAFENFVMLQKKSVISMKNPITFVYLTRGLLTNLSDAMDVLNVIAQGQRALLRPIRLNICAVVADEKSLMHEKQFLGDIAMQNYTKYNIVVSWQPRLVSGKLLILTKAQSDLLMQTAVAIFENVFTSQYVSANLEMHSPVVDADRDNIVSMTQAVVPYGVVGVNLYLSDLIEDIVDYRLRSTITNIAGSDVYMFLIDYSGRTLSHPAFPRPYARAQNYYSVDISLLENSTNFNSIRERLLNATDSDNATTTVFINKQHRTELMDRFYYWQSILGIYIMCLVVTTERAAAALGNSTSTNSVSEVTTDMKSNLQLYCAEGPLETDQFDIYAAHNSQLNKYNDAEAFDFLYHRLDLLPNKDHLCRYFHQIATMDSPTLYLSASAFESPFSYLQNVRMGSKHTQTHTVETIMTYLKNTLGLLANPGLKLQIPHEVETLLQAMQKLRLRHHASNSAFRQHIIRRYIASVSGVLLVYPGCLLTNEYEPTQRRWFNQALQHPGRLVITAPYLDAGGAGYIITVAHSILEGKANAMHLPQDRRVAVVAMDLPAAFYDRLLLDQLPLCQQPNIKCLLFEHEGYLIAHPSLWKPNSQRRWVEHLTHKESDFANDILNHKYLVRKIVCANYLNRTLQRNYRFNTSLDEILSNVMNKERTKYALTLVPGSNIFAAVLKITSESDAFCPCSTIDRVCFNCNRMDQMDCECPCECPMLHLNEEIQQNYTLEYAYCMPPNEYFLALPAANVAEQYIPACISTNCEMYGTQQKCLGVMGCEWCQQDLEGTLFTAPFCTAQANCFNGVLSAATPYDELDDIGLAVRGYIPIPKTSSYSPFGPAGGAIAVLGIVIGFAIYCYRHNMDTQTADPFYVDSMHEENYGLPLSRFNFDDCQAHEDYGGGRAFDHSGAQTNQLINAAEISPYHMSSGSSYRRPPNGESDHGYSTMTPHEDSSEHQCFTLAEPLLLNDQINRHSKSDTMSISTTISSPHSRQHSSKGYGMSSGNTNISSPTQRQQIAKVNSPARSLGTQTQLSEFISEQTHIGPHYILAPVTVHRHMETSES